MNGAWQIPVGDQPSDIERQIRGLVLDYISKPNWCSGLLCSSGYLLLTPPQRDPCGIRSQRRSCQLGISQTCALGRPTMP